MPKTKTYKKISDREKVRKDLSKDRPILIRIHRETCPACQMSEKPWQEFCKRGAPGYMILEIEEKAMPPEILSGITGFPTYAIHDARGNNRHHTGALMSPEDIEEFVSA